ncbi:MAG: cytochrome c biogenesis protein CcsA, partial [Cyanobacteria bacterium HKST-UBA05]|nr:cytochrome c biogenesis protein CcsA [Cyanobacteria bacterium HKST-UBA05]
MNTFNWLQLEQMGASAGLLLVALGTLMYVLHVLLPKPWLRLTATIIMGLAAVSLMASVAARSIQAEFFALSNMYEALLICTIGLLVAFVVIERWFSVPNLGWAVGFLALIMLFYGGSLPTDITPLQAALRSYWRAIHVPPLLLSYGFFTVAFFSSVGFLVVDTKQQGALSRAMLRESLLPADGIGAVGGTGGGEVSAYNADQSNSGGLLDRSFTGYGAVYDEVTYRAIAAGFPLLMIGVILGALWANEAWGNYWSWDPKESMSLVTLLGYGVYLHMRLNGEHSPRTLAWVSVIGFLLVL